MSDCLLRASVRVEVLEEEEGKRRRKWGKVEPESGRGREDDLCKASEQLTE